MSSRKRISGEGIGRIWKSTLAQTVDSVGSRAKKDNPQRTPSIHNTSNKSLSDKDTDHDDLDAVNIQEALQNIRSLPGSGQASHKGCVNIESDLPKSDKENDDSSIKNIVVKINNDVPAKRNEQSHNRRFYSIREVMERNNDTQDTLRSENMSQLSTSGSKTFGNDRGSMRRKEATSNKGRDERREQDVPPRLRNRRNEEMNNFGQRKEDSDLEMGKVVLDVASDKESLSSGLGNQTEMDAYDKWKLKRQATSNSNNNVKNNFKGTRARNMGSMPFKMNEQIKEDCRKSDENQKIIPSLLESCTVYSSKLKNSEGNENLDKSRRDDFNPLTSTTMSEGGGLSHSYDEEWGDEDTADYHVSTSQEENSAMDKIQNLFQTYISPVTQRNAKDSDSKRPQQKEIASSNDHENVKNEKESADTLKEAHCTAKGDVVCKDTKSDKEIYKSMENLQLVDDKSESGQKGRYLSHLEKHEADKQESDNVRKLKYPPNVQSVVQSPASIPSGFSSDYEVGIISQSETEEDDADADDESPHPCANLFPSSHSHIAENEQQDQLHDFSTPAHLSHWHSYYNGNQSSPMPHHQMPYPLPPAPWFHPYYNHPDPFRHPYHPAPPQSSQLPFVGTESSHFPGQQPPPQPHSSIMSNNKLIIPSNKFNSEDNINRVKDFIAAKTEQWNKLMIQHHGEAVPVDVVISVTLSGATTSNDAAGGTRLAPNSYPANSGWQYPMYPHPNMGYNYNSYWPQPHGDEVGAHQASNRVPHDVQHAERGESNESVKVRQNHHSLQQNPQTFSEHPHHTQSESAAHPHAATESDGLSQATTDETDCISEDTMKRRALSYDDVGGSSREVQAKSKRSRNQVHGDENTLQDDSNARREPNCKSTLDKDSKKNGSVSSFLNPSSLKNDSATPPRQTSAETSHSKYELGSGQPSKEKERDRSPHATGGRFQHRSYRSNKYNTSFNEDEDKGDRDRAPSPASTQLPPVSTATKTSYNDKSVCVVERKSALTESNAGGKRLSEEYEPISGTWAEISPEPEPTAVETAYSSSTSKQKQGFGSDSHDRRRSDSFVGYGSHDRSPLARDYRLSRTPGVNRDRMEATADWKQALVARSKDYNHPFIDTHCHLDFLYNRTKTATIPYSQYMKMNADSYPVNYEGCVAVFCNPNVFSDHTQAHGILQLLVKEDKVWVAIGCHPKSATDFRRHHLLRLKRYLMDHPRVVALGEIGLDYSGTFHQHIDVQKEVFIQQLKLALELNLPLVIHCRDADADCLAIMKKYIPAKHKIHLHCFTRHISICRQWMDHFPNLFVGFTPLITYNSAMEATDAAALVPLERLLLETDAPYFIPYGTERRGISHPGLAIFTAERLAEIRDTSVDTVLKACRRNTRAMYGV